MDLVLWGGESALRWALPMLRMEFGASRYGCDCLAGHPNGGGTQRGLPWQRSVGSPEPCNADRLAAGGEFT